MNKIILTLLAALLIASPLSAREQRSEAAKSAFKATHPCPSNGARSGPCPGYIIDHVQPLACGGQDAPENMQWQTETDAHAKDKWERKGCDGNHEGPASASSAGASGAYHRGPRGGCYTITSGGNKRYVSRDLCD